MKWTSQGWTSLGWARLGWARLGWLQSKCAPSGSMKTSRGRPSRVIVKRKLT